MTTSSLSADAIPARQPARYALAVPVGARARLATGWLWLALLALLGSGLFSILLVLARAPLTQDLFATADFFRVALVVHVDLSVLVWFSAFAGLLWTLSAGERAIRVGRAGLAACAAGTLALCVAPFVGREAPVMSNYVPVLDGPVFLGGLVLFAAGAGLLVGRTMFAARRVGTRPDGNAALVFGTNAAAISAAVALLAFAWSYAALPRSLDGKAYYEVLFWGGGHVLQFTWTLLMFTAWLALADASGARVPLTPRVAILLFAIGLAAVFATPVIYLAYDITSVEHYRLQTWLMRIGGGLAIVPFSAAMLYALATAPRAQGEERPLRAALGWSLALFGAGGVIGFLIDGSNVKIPAHYHGAIVGVTLAFMGLTYHLLPRLGLARPAPRLAALQPWLYGAGQLAHITGLVWSGGYGVQRKVAGAAQALQSAEQVAAMGLMGFGGLAAVAGGFVFVLIVLRSAWTCSGSR
ncbi:MAG: cbb3-type cytochrome c oxidase subunit I [Burkholderiales bacterium]